MKVFFVSDKLRKDKARQRIILRDLDFVRQGVMAIETHMNIIKETEDEEVIMTSLEAIEEILPGAKKMIRKRAKIFEEIADKCIEMGVI